MMTQVSDISHKMLLLKLDGLRRRYILQYHMYNLSGDILGKSLRTAHVVALEQFNLIGQEKHDEGSQG